MGCWCGSSLCNGTALCAVISWFACEATPYITVPKAVIDAQTDRAISSAISGLNTLGEATAQKHPAVSETVGKFKTGLETFEVGRRARRSAKAEKAAAQITEEHDCKCGHDHGKKHTHSHGGCNCSCNHH